MEVVVPGGLEINLIYSILLFCIALFSVSLNSLVIWVTLIRDKRKRAIDSQLILLIALFDVCMGMFIIISQIIEWSSTNAKEFRGGSWCIFSAIMYDAFTIIPICLTSQLSVIRYLAIVKSYTIKNIKSTIASIIIIISILLVFIIATCVGHSKLMSSGAYCIPAHRYPGSVGDIVYSICMLLILAPNIVIIPFCYGMISHYYKKTAQRLQVEVTKISNKQFHKRYGYIIALSFISTAYIASILPEIILFGLESSYDTYSHRSNLTDQITFTLLFGVTIINPLFVLTLHKESRDQLLSKLFNKKQSSQVNIDL